MRRVLVVALVTFGSVMLISVVLFGRSRSDALQSNMVQSGQQAIDRQYPAPAFTATTMAGADVHLSQYRGKPVVINFFADWCGPCKAEAPQLSQIASSYKGKVTMLSIARDSTRSGVRSFAARYGMTWPILWDGNDDLTHAFKIPGQPVTFVVDPHGRVVWEQLGPISTPAVGKVLNGLLAG
jgi:cytochrome c biogenesis protein CcmG/thiol:disulfide interchange protein DsbE